MLSSSQNIAVLLESFMFILDRLLFTIILNYVSPETHVELEETIIQYAEKIACYCYIVSYDKKSPWQFKDNVMSNIW